MSQSKTYKVTTLVDENDGGSGGSGLSLREAIAQANANPGTDKIVFKASLKNGTIVLENGVIDITDGLEIKGLGANKLTISGNNQSHIFDITDETTLDGITITGGQILDDDGAREIKASAISASAPLTIQRSVITGNADTRRPFPDYDPTVTADNAAIVNNGYRTRIIDSELSDNGISISSDNGTIDIQRSQISGNSRFGVSGFETDITVSNSVISGNDIGVGVNYGSALITQSTIEQNGLGIASYTASTVVKESNITNNGNGLQGGFAQIDSSNISDNSGVGVYGYSVTILSSTVSGNGDAGIKGGYFGPINVINSTISGNRQNGIEIDRGYGYEAPVTILNSTITENAVDGGHGIAVNFEYPQFTDPIRLGNSIVAGNSGNADLLAVVTSQGNNLIGNGDSAIGLVNGINGDQVGTAASPLEAQLGPLQNNGGLTKTHTLLPGSPGIDAGNNAIIPTTAVLFPGLGDDGVISIDVSTDQRGVGFARIVNDVVDIGAIDVRSVINPPPIDPPPIDPPPIDPPPIDPPPTETIVGTDRKDKLQGSDNGDRIEGLDGNDLINGNGGDDTIVGGMGKDDVTGGSGADSFVFTSLQDKGDIIRDFELGSDTIDLSQIFSTGPFANFGDATGRFENYVRVRSRSQGVSVEVDSLGDNGTKFVRMAFVKNIGVDELTISDFRLT